MNTSKMYLKRITLFCLILSIPILFPCCESDDDGDEDESLYEQLGERDGIENAVEKSILAIASDPELTPFFAVVLQEEGGMDPGLDALKENLADFVDEGSGGNATYNGLSMAEAHAASNPRMSNAGNITNEIYDAFLDAMITGAQQAGISETSTLNAYRELLEQNRSDIVL